MGIEQDVSQAAFLAFASDATLNAYTVKVVVDRNVEVADEDGNVRYFAALVHALKCGLPEWASGDVLETDEGDLYLRQLVSDDGYIQRIEAST